MSQIYDIFTKNRTPSYSICYERDDEAKTTYVSAVAPPGSNAGAMREVRFEIKTMIDSDHIVSIVRLFLEDPDRVSEKSKKVLRRCMISNY